jgi:hypothetical protein
MDGVRILFYFFSILIYLILIINRKILPSLLCVASLWTSTSSIRNQKSRIRNQVKPQLRHLILPVKKVLIFKNWSKLLPSGLSHFRQSSIYFIYVLSTCWCIFSEFDLTSGWETIKNNVDVNQSVAVLDLGSNELPLTQGEDGEQVL